MKKRWLTLLGFGLYFGLLLLPKAFPRLAATPFFTLLWIFLLVLIPSLLVLLGLNVLAALFSSLRRRLIPLRVLDGVYTASMGLALFVVFVVLARVLPSALPDGSHRQPYDRDTWLASNATSYVRGAITPRQEMLADVIRRLPGKNRAEIEHMLGPSLDTPYFIKSRRDMIYMTGPERDTFAPLDSEWLLIWLNKDGVYERHRVMND